MQSPFATLDRFPIYNDCANGDVIRTDGTSFVRATATGAIVGTWDAATSEFAPLSDSCALHGHTYRLSPPCVVCSAIIATAMKGAA